MGVTFYTYMILCFKYVVCIVYIYIYNIEFCKHFCVSSSFPYLASHNYTQK